MNNSQILSQEIENIRQILFSRNRSRATYSQQFVTIISVTVITLFACWWFNPEHIADNFSGYANIVDVLLFFAVSWIVWHPILMEVVVWAIVSHIKEHPQELPQPGLRVAFITTIVPGSEPLDLLHKCLPAMVNADYPHDTWLLDEGNNEEVKKICAKYGVKHFSRYEDPRYYMTGNDKFTKTKGGNHNAWYDAYGNNYDFVAQLDTDFVPHDNFLTKTLGYFNDPEVGFVGTPQIYGNLRKSFIARGAAEQQYSFYGSVLRGLSGLGMTFMIGANHVVRVKALKDIGHYAAHITEDLITGMKLHASGWKSIYLPEALAVGEGPFTWESYFNQQMRWAFGCFDILLRHSFRQFFRMGLRRAIYYFLLQLHYFSGIANALSILLIAMYFFSGIRATDIDFVKFITYYFSVIIICWLMSVWYQRYHIGQDKEEELLIPGKIISIAAWPIWFVAFLSALTGRRLSYKVTPKGESNKNTQLSSGLFLPHYVFGTISVMCLISTIHTQRFDPLMIFWALSSAASLFLVPFSQYISEFYFRVYSGLLSVSQRLYRHKNIRDNLFIDQNLNQHSSGEIIEDCLFLSIIVISSLILYVAKIGFYSDDWSFIGSFSVSSRQSLIGLIQTATTPNTFMRPVQNVYDALLYYIFGVDPLGYQLVNSFVFLLIILIAYFVLREIRMPRILTITVPMIYALLPNYTTDRFWYAAYQVNLSVMLYLLSLYAGLRALSHSAIRTLSWKIVSLLCLILSGLSYEVALPLFLLNMVLFWDPVTTFNKHYHKQQFFRRNYMVFNIVTFMMLGCVLLFKALTTTRLGTLDYQADVFTLLRSVAHVNYVVMTRNLVSIWKDIFILYYSPSILILGVGIGIFIFWYIYTVISKPLTFFPGHSYLRNVVIAGICVFFFGYAIFFTNNKVGFSPTGIDNRVAIAASMGVALSVVGVIGWLGKIFLTEFKARMFFCTVISLVGVSGFLIINTLAVFWIDAYRQAQAIKNEIYMNFPSLPKNSTVILDGVCPYNGPAVVFESQWDLMGALQAHYKDPTIGADIVTPRLKVTERGIRTQIYTFVKRYPYKNLFIYNYKTKQTHIIESPQSARDYFNIYNPDHNNGCPPSRAGHGVDVF